MMDTERLLTVTEASHRLGIRPATIRKWILLKKLGYCKIGRAVRLPESVVSRLIADGIREAVPAGGRDDR